MGITLVLHPNISVLVSFFYNTVILTEINGIAAANSQFFYACTARKRGTHDACYAVSDYHIRQSGTAIKNVFPDACHAVSDHHTHQSGTAIKRFIPDARHAVRDCYAR